MRVSPLQGACIFGLFVSLVMSGCSRCSSPPAKPPEPTQTATMVAPTQTPTVAVPPTIEALPTIEAPTQMPAATEIPSPPPMPDLPTAGPEPTKNPAIVSACKKIRESLESGNFKALPPLLKQRTALAAGPALSAVACLAIAADNPTHCDGLPKASREVCVSQTHLLRELKTTPKEMMKAQVIYRDCLRSASKAQCDIVREAMTTKDAGKCKGAVKPADRSFCIALVTGNSDTCKDLPDEALRAACMAYATNDAAHCSEKMDPGCAKVMRAFAAFEQDGMAAYAQIDPTLAAAVSQGKSACAPLLEALEADCLLQ